jgi:ABC-2 type transport system ATP-binding protein
LCGPEIIPGANYGEKIEMNLNQNGNQNHRPVLLVEGLTKKYHTLMALDKISLQVYRGESAALWGANGAGKTTLIKSLLGLLNYQGKVLVAGIEAKAEGKAVRKLIGYVPQEAVFYDMSVWSTVVFYARLKKADPKDMLPLLESMDLLEHLKKPVPALSGGLKQRLALAVALIADPPILLFDEPTANLDSRSRQEYLQLLARLHSRGKTILFASHRKEEVETLAERVFILDAGHLVDETTSKSLRGRHEPEIKLTLWISDEQRVSAQQLLAEAGMKAHINGRGTLVVQMPSKEKMAPMQIMARHKIDVLDFEVEAVQEWN